jgi:hypothetical protein
MTYILTVDEPHLSALNLIFYRSKRMKIINYRRIDSYIQKYSRDERVGVTVNSEDNKSKNMPFY